MSLSPSRLVLISGGRLEFQGEGFCTYAHNGDLVARDLAGSPAADSRVSGKASSPISYLLLLHPVRSC